MLIPKGSLTWKSTKSRLPASRQIWFFLTKTRFLPYLTGALIILLLWSSFGGTAGEMQRSPSRHKPMLRSHRSN